MGWVPGIVVYIIIWWVVIFAVLPFGVRPAEEGDVGHAAGAPGNPRLLLKAVVTTLISAALWLVVYWAVTSSLISFRESY